LNRATPARHTTQGRKDGVRTQHEENAQPIFNARTAQATLRCPFVEAGTKHCCPTCQRSLVVPGDKEAQEVLDEEAFRLEVAQRRRISLSK